MTLPADAPTISGGTVASMATFPARKTLIPKVVESVLDQVDHLFVYLNDYDSVPSFLEDDKITAFLSKDCIGDISATGKVYALQFVKDSYFFCLDDDFVFPPDYFASMKQVIDTFNRRVAVCVHGSIFPHGPRYYYERSRMYGWRQALGEHKVVSLIGSGTFGFHQSSFEATFEDFLPNVMVDLRFSILAKDQGVPLLAVRRPSEWIRYLGGVGLWEEFRAKLTHHTDALVENEPWDFLHFSEMVRRVFIEEFGEFSEEAALKYNFDREFTQAALSGVTPASWGRSSVTYRRRRDHLRLLAEQMGIL